MTGTISAPATSSAYHETRATRRARAKVALRPWSALICGVPGDNTLLVVDWLVLACREAGLVAHAVPLVGSEREPFGMYVEVAADAEQIEELDSVPWGAVDMVVAGEHLELLRAIEAGFVDPDVTRVFASCHRSYTSFEHVVAPQLVLQEHEIDAIATRSAQAYYGFDGREVAGWYDLPQSAQAGLLLGALVGSDATPLDERHAAAAISRLGIVVGLHREALRRGLRLGRRPGGRIRRPRTAYQFTRRRRAVVDHTSRELFEQLVARCDDVVAPEHVPAMQAAIFQLTCFQDAAWAERFVTHVADLHVEERRVLGDAWRADASIVPDAIRSLVALMIWPDAAWVARSKLRSERFKEIRAAHGLTRGDAYELVEYVPVDAVSRAETRAPRFRIRDDAATPALLQPQSVERIDATTLRGAIRLRRLARSARWRADSLSQRRELDTVESWLTAMFDSLRADHALAQIVARTGTIVQGAGAVRDATRQTATIFWGQIVRQTLAIDRTAPPAAPSVARIVIPFVWDQLARSGPLALWEHAAPVVGIAMHRSRGGTHEQAYAQARRLCGIDAPSADQADRALD